MNENNKKSLVISGINIFQGGPLSILTDCLSYINQSSIIDKYEVTVLVHKKKLFDNNSFININFIELPKSRQSYIYRIYYEYIYFKKLAKNLKVDFWLSLHDITPNVGNINQAVYCHNASPFYELKFKNLFIIPTYFLFTLFYQYLYQINIKKNRFVIVQQFWIKEKFRDIYKLNPNKILVSKPQVSSILPDKDEKIYRSDTYTFFFPSYPRPYKNFEIICQATKILWDNGITNFKVILTVDGSENIYSKKLFEKYKAIQNINFIGIIKRTEVFNFYKMVDCLIFPSKLESWGLPISEFIQFNKPILIADLPYAIETIGNYRKVKYFNPEDVLSLVKLMKSLILNEDIKYDCGRNIYKNESVLSNWNELFDILLKT